MKNNLYYNMYHIYKKWKNNNGTRYKEIPKGAMFEKNDKKKRNAINNNAWVQNKEI